MRTSLTEPRAARRGMTANGCFLVAFGMILFLVLITAISGYFFYRNFGAALFVARDEVQPVGELFIHKIDEQSYQAAYNLLAEGYRSEWEPEKFGTWAKEVRDTLGSLRSIAIDAGPTAEAVMQAKGDELKRLPMRFDCSYEKGTCQFDLIFEKTETVWRIVGLAKEIKLPEKKKEIMDVEKNATE